MNVAKNKTNQIAKFYLFHKKINSIFNRGINLLFKFPQKNFFNFLIPTDVNKIENFYIININWINSWKKYSQYNEAKKNLDLLNVDALIEEQFKEEIKKICNDMISAKEIKNSEEFKPIEIDNQSYGNIFLHKLIYNLEDFESLVDEDTYKLFKNLSPNLNSIMIKGMILDKMIILLIEKERKIKFLFHIGKNINSSKLIQLTADFNETLNIKPFKKLEIINLDNALTKFHEFIFSDLIKKNSDYFIDTFIKEGIEKKENITFETETKEIYYILKNDNIYKESLEKENKISNTLFINVNKKKYIGLENIGATCYMNATLQCLINTDALTRFLLTEKIFIYIMNNIKLFELTSCYCDLLLNTVCCNESSSIFKPTKFKNVISRKNPYLKE